MLPIWIKSRPDNSDDCEWDEPIEWTIDVVLDEINRDRSEEWDDNPITKFNWIEGWEEVESEGFNKLVNRANHDPKMPDKTSGSQGLYSQGKPISKARAIRFDNDWH